VADENVDNLSRLVKQLVVADTDGVSALDRGQLLTLSAGHVEMIKPLADNLDLPGRLAPSVSEVLKHRGGQSYDRRVDIRAGLTEMVALYADALAPEADLPEPVDAGNRNRLATAVTRAYAAFATPRITPGLFPNGRPDDLGRFPPPVLEGDPAAARAMALAIGARIARGEEYVLNHLVAAGHGGAAQAAAELLLRGRPEYNQLPESQKPGIARQLARGIESGFAVRDLRQAATRELTEEMENRRVDIAGGAGTVNAVSAMATQELQQLHEFLKKIDYWEQSVAPTEGAQTLDEVRAIVARGLVSRVEHHAGIATDLTDGQVESPPAVTVAAAETMVTMSAIPAESRPAATAATAGMLAEGFDELPTLVANWTADGSDVNQQAALYGGALGDRTLAAVRTFERQPPDPRVAEPGSGQVTMAAYGTDPAIPPLDRVHGPAGEVRLAGDGSARSRNKGSDGLNR
jgi:hypothetical protein